MLAEPIVSLEPGLTRETTLVAAVPTVWMVSSPPISSVAPPAMVTPDVVERRLSPVVASLPALTVVAPAKVLAPPSVRVPLPDLVRPPLLTTPLKVTFEAVVRVRVAPPRPTVPPSVKAPVLVVSPRVRSPPMTRLFASE